jgi:PAS domain S-box-containing protein
MNSAIFSDHGIDSPEERYRRATVAGRVGVWDWNLASDEIYVDPILKEILGYRDDEISNRFDDWGRLVHPDDAEAVMAKAQEHIDGKTPFYQVEHRMVHRDGSVRWFLARGSVTRDSTGKAVTMVGTDTDITERKEHEEALRQAEEINRRIVENTTDCVKILDLEGRLQHINGRSRPGGPRKPELAIYRLLARAIRQGAMVGRGDHAHSGCQWRRHPGPRHLPRHHRTPAGRKLSSGTAWDAREDRGRQRIVRRAGGCGPTRGAILQGNAVLGIAGRARRQDITTRGRGEPPR